MTTDERVDQIMGKYGVPENKEVLRAVLAYAVQQGRVDGAEEMKTTILEALARGQLSS